MNKGEIIEKLTSFAEELDGGKSMFVKGKAEAYRIAARWIKRLDEPTAPEVVVPQWFVEWIRDFSGGDRGQIVYYLWSAYQNDLEGNSVTKNFSKTERDWLRENKELATRAILDGYTVEKEPLYYVKLFDDERGYLKVDREIKVRIISDNSSGDFYRAKFTKDEIKAINPNYWPFAVKVEG